MNTTTNLDSLSKAIQSALEEETRKIVEEEAKNAAARVEERVRGLVGQIATRVASWVSFERTMQEIRITVSLPEQK